MNTIHRFFLGVIGVAVLGAGCTSTRISLPAASTAHYDESKPRRISGEGSGFQLLLFIPIGVNERYEHAWNELKAQAGNDTIGDVTVQDSWTYGLVGTVYSVRMEANAYPTITP